MKISVINDDKTFTDIIDLERRAIDITYPYYNNKRPAVVVDTEHWLVGELNDHKTAEHWLSYYKALGKQEYISKLRALKAIEDNTSNTSIQSLISLALNDNLEHIRVYAIRVLQKIKSENTQKKFKTELLFLASNDPSNDVRAIANHVIGVWGIEDANDQLYAALSDSSYLVVTSALGAIAKSDPDTAYIISKRILSKGEAKGNLVEQVWGIIGKNAASTDSSIIREHKYIITGRNKIGFAAAMGAYMKNVPSDKAFEIALDIAEFMALSEAIGGYRANIASYIYDAGYYYKNEVDASNNKADLSKVNRRLNMLRNSMLRMENQEKDEDNLANFKLYRTEIYGTSR